MAEERELPGWPKKRLVKRVRSHLWHYGIRPKGEAWRATWIWASAIATSYYHTQWPLASEIATQYLLLLPMSDTLTDNTICNSQLVPVSYRTVLKAIKLTDSDPFNMTIRCPIEWA